MNLQKEIDESLARIYARIDKRFRGARIATGKHCAKALREIDRKSKVYELRGSLMGGAVTTGYLTDGKLDTITTTLTVSQ